MPRQVHPPRAYDSPRRQSSASNDGRRSSNTAFTATSSTAGAHRAQPSTGLRKPGFKAAPTRKVVEQQQQQQQQQQPPLSPEPLPSLLQSVNLAASVFDFPAHDSFTSLLSATPLLAPPRYAARISLTSLNLSSDGAGSPARPSTLHAGPPTPPSSGQEQDDSTPRAKKGRDSGFVGSDEAREGEAYQTLLGESDSSHLAQASLQQSRPPQRALTLAPQSPLKSSFSRSRKRTTSAINSPARPGTENSPNPKARKQAKASSSSKSLSRSLSDHRFAFSTPGAGPSKRPNAPRTERPAKRSVLSQSVKAAATQRRKSAPHALPKGVHIVRTATDPHMPPPPESPGDDPILLKANETIRQISPSSDADELRNEQARLELEEEDEMGISDGAGPSQAAAPTLANLDQSSDADFWGGGMDVMDGVSNLLDVTGGLPSDSDDEDPDNTFHPGDGSSRHELRLSDLDSFRPPLFAQPPTTTTSRSRSTTPQAARSRSTTPQAAPPPSPQRLSKSPTPRAQDSPPRPKSKSPVARTQANSPTPSPRARSITPLVVAREPSPRARSITPVVVSREPSPASSRRSPTATPPSQRLVHVDTPAPFPQPSPSTTPTSQYHMQVADAPALLSYRSPTSSTPASQRMMQVDNTAAPPSHPSSTSTPSSQRTVVADTPAPFLSPYVFGPPRAPESYSGSEMDEDEQHRHSLVLDADADGTTIVGARSARADSVFSEIDREWAQRDRSLDESGWGARIRSSLSPDSSDGEGGSGGEDEMTLGADATLVQQPDILEKLHLEVEVVEPPVVEQLVVEQPVFALSVAEQPAVEQRVNESPHAEQLMDEPPHIEQPLAVLEDSSRRISDEVTLIDIPPPRSFALFRSKIPLKTAVKPAVVVEKDVGDNSPEDVTLIEAGPAVVAKQKGASDRPLAPIALRAAPVELAAESNEDQPPLKSLVDSQHTVIKNSLRQSAGVALPISQTTALIDFDSISTDTTADDMPFAVADTLPEDDWRIQHVVVSSNELADPVLSLAQATAQPEAAPDPAPADAIEPLLAAVDNVTVPSSAALPVSLPRAESPLGDAEAPEDELIVIDLTESDDEASEPDDLDGDVLDKASDASDNVLDDGGKAGTSPSSEPETEPVHEVIVMDEAQEDAVGQASVLVDEVLTDTGADGAQAEGGNDVTSLEARLTDTQGVVHDAEVYQRDGDDNTGFESDATHTPTDRDGEDDDDANSEDGDGDSFFGEIERKSLGDDMEGGDQDDVDILDVTAGAFDLHSEQLEEFRAFINAAEDSETTAEQQDFDALVASRRSAAELFEEVRRKEPETEVNKQGPAEMEKDHTVNEEHEQLTAPHDAEEGAPPASAPSPSTATSAIEAPASIKTFYQSSPSSPVALLPHPSPSPALRVPLPAQTEPLIEHAAGLAAQPDVFDAPVAVPVAEGSSSRSPCEPTGWTPSATPSPARLHYSPSAAAAGRFVPDLTAAATPAPDRSIVSSGEPWIKITSNDPRQAARATAFLKMFHDYVETASEANDSVASSSRDQSFASRASSHPRRSSTSRLADLSMISVADDLLMEAEQQIALEDDRAADVHMSFEEDENLPIPGSFTRSGSTQSLASLLKGKAPARRVPDRPWGPTEWRTLMESLDSLPAQASTEAVVRRFMRTAAVEEEELVGEWSWTKLSLRIASIQQRRANERQRATKRRRSHHPQKELLLPHKAASPALARKPPSPAVRQARRRPLSPPIRTVSSKSLAQRVLGLFNVFKQPPPALRPRKSIPEFSMASPARSPPASHRPPAQSTPHVIPPSPVAAERASHGQTPPSRSSSPAAHGILPLRQLAFGGSPTHTLNRASSPGAPRRQTPSPPSVLRRQASTSSATAAPISIPPSRIPTASRKATNDLPLKPRSSFDTAPPSVSQLVRSFESARSLESSRHS